MLRPRCPVASRSASFESYALLAPPPWNPAFHNRCRGAILRGCLVASSIECSRDDAMPLTLDLGRDLL